MWPVFGESAADLARKQKLREEFDKAQAQGGKQEKDNKEGDSGYTDVTREEGEGEGEQQEGEEQEFVPTTPKTPRDHSPSPQRTPSPEPVEQVELLNLQALLHHHVPQLHLLLQ